MVSERIELDDARGLADDVVITVAHFFDDGTEVVDLETDRAHQAQHRKDADAQQQQRERGEQGDHGAREVARFGGRGAELLQLDIAQFEGRVAHARIAAGNAARAFIGRKPACAPAVDGFGETLRARVQDGERGLFVGQREIDARCFDRRLQSVDGFGGTCAIGGFAHAVFDDGAHDVGKLGADAFARIDDDLAALRDAVDAAAQIVDRIHRGDERQHRERDHHAVAEQQSRAQRHRPCAAALQAVLLALAV